jgi:CheY-like chemotaxis protein
LQEEQAIDMVLTDYCMPEMTGYDLLKAIKVLQNQSLQHVCVRFVSAFRVATCLDGKLFQL